MCLVCGLPPEIELRVTLVHCTLESVLYLTHDDSALRHSVSMTRVSGQLPLMTASPLSTPVGVTSRFV